MRVIDLSWALDNETQPFPGDSPPRLERVVESGFRSTAVAISSHSGTHIDAPAHILPDGAYLDELPCESFFGLAVVADVSALAGGEIRADLLCLSEISQADFLLLHSGWDEKMGKKEYLAGFPVLSQETARLLAGLRLKGIGIDAISFDPVESAECPIHKILLGAGTLLIENLRGLRRLPFKKPFCLAALPLSIKKSDAAPARVTAVLEK